MRDALREPAVELEPAQDSPRHARSHFLVPKEADAPFTDGLGLRFADVVQQRGPADFRFGPRRGQDTHRVSKHVLVLPALFLLGLLQGNQLGHHQAEHPDFQEPDQCASWLRRQ